MFGWDENYQKIANSLRHTIYQVGTFRYMAPEVLDTRVHLQDLQSFKQIDIYAFSLIMWEVMSRCRIHNILGGELYWGRG